MPTGYTADLVDGPQEFEDFVLLCARAMSPFIMQRDDDMVDRPRKMKVEDTYGGRTLAEYEARLEAWNAKTDEQHYEDYVEYAKNVAKGNAESIAKAGAVRERLEDTLVKVKTWQIPEILEPFRGFMIQQLESTIDFDGTPYTQEILTYADWLDHEERLLYRMITTYQDEVQKEKERIEFQHNYTDALYKALGIEYNE